MFTVGFFFVFWGQKYCCSQLDCLFYFFGQRSINSDDFQILSYLMLFVLFCVNLWFRSCFVCSQVLYWLYSIIMDAPNELSYKPPPEFEEVKKDSLIHLDITDSTELWLIQWPFNQVRFMRTYFSSTFRM